MANLFWNSLTQSTDDFSKILEHHKNKSKIHISIQYKEDNNQSFFEENQDETGISDNVYEIIQDMNKWSQRLPSYTNSSNKQIDYYSKINYNKELLSFLYDKEEDGWFDDSELEKEN